MFLVLVAMGVLATQCHQPPTVVAGDAPTHLFSAERASAHLERLLADESPHPLGSAANDKVRQRLIAELEEIGLTPAVHERWVVSTGTWSSTLARVHNVTVELPSAHPGKPAILLACHYDSVGAGPGAGDDMAAVAALLEVARILQAEMPLDRPVVFLFTDGEEIGLYGAQAFAMENPLADRVGVVLNFEARGTGGGSLMFETSEGNRWLIQQAARGLRRPMSSSAYVDVYRRMPNSSDLTVFMRRDLAGMNFAFIGNPKHYHTPLDNLANLDRRSLQHHGENALGMVRQLLAADWSDAFEAHDDAVYTDLFGRWIIGWPAAWGPWIAALVLALSIVCLRLGRMQQRFRTSQLVTAAACWLLIVIAGIGFAWLGVKLLALANPLLPPWPAAMQWDVATLCACASVGVVLALLLVKPAPAALLAMHSVALALGALALSLTLTGFSYLLLLPAVPTALGTLVVAMRHSPRTGLAATCLADGVVMVLLTVPFLMRLPEALGIVLAAPVLGLVVTLLLLCVAPLLVEFSRRRLLILLTALGAFGATCFLGAVLSPPFTHNSPQHLTLTHLEHADRGEALLILWSGEAPVPAPLLDRHKRVEEPRSLFSLPGIALETFSAELPTPEAQVLSVASDSGLHRASLRLRRSQPGQEVLIGIPDSHEWQSVTAAERALRTPPESKDGHKWLRFLGIPEHGIDVEISWPGSDSLPLAVMGITSGLPPESELFARKRNPLPAVPVHRGDRSIVISEVLLGE